MQRVVHPRERDDARENGHAEQGAAPGLGRAQTFHHQETRLHEGHPGQQIEAKEPERQDPGVPEPSLGRQPEHQGGEHRHDAQKGAHPVAARQGEHDAGAGQDVEPGIRTWKQAAHVVGDLLVAHVGGVRQAGVERKGPEGNQGAPDNQDCDRPLDAPAIEAHEGEHDGPTDGEEQRQDVRDPAGGQEESGQRPVPAVLEAPGDQPQEHQGDGEADREAELPGHRRRDVAAVDGELPPEKIREGGQGEAGRTGKAQPGQPPEPPRRDWQGQQAGNGDQLEGNVVRDDVGQQGDGNDGAREIKRQGGKAVVPVGCPAGKPQVGQQAGLDIGGQPDVSAHVAPRRGCVLEQLRRLQLLEREDHTRRHHDEGDHRLAVRHQPSQP